MVHKGKRVIGFGKFAGYAGMIDLLRGLGDRLLGLGYTNPFLGMGYTDYYHSFPAAKNAISLVGNSIQINGIPKDHSPLIFGFTGATGNVGLGALEVFRELPHEFIKTDDLVDVVRNGDRNIVYGLLIEREDYIKPIEPNKSFDRKDYDANPHLYRSNFHKRIAPYLSVLVNCMYWDARFPRLLTVDQMRDLYQSGRNRLLAIADISADMHGSIEFTRFATTIDRPYVVYNPDTDSHAYK
jgi:alpha-aminoadipic semialdehyde synthase